MQKYGYKRILSAYFELTKPRITSLVLITTALGFILGAHGVKMFDRLVFLLLGAGLTCGGASVLNHYLERDVDAKMFRTLNRPLPLGIISPSQAMSFGVILVLLGVFLLWWKVSLLSAFLSLLTAFLYVVVYTPLKRLSWINTTIGAIPGALPPLGGWAAAKGTISPEALVLFLILFLWQHPHFYAIAWMCREDYARGGLKMLPVIEPDGQSTFRQIKLYTALLLLVSIVPFTIGMSGGLYLSGAVALGLLFFLAGVELSMNRTLEGAKDLLKNSVIYLPALLVFILLDANF